MPDNEQNQNQEADSSKLGTPETEPATVSEEKPVAPKKKAAKKKVAKKKVAKKKVAKKKAVPKKKAVRKKAAGETVKVAAAEETGEALQTTPVDSPTTNLVEEEKETMIHEEPSVTDQSTGNSTNDQLQEKLKEMGIMSSDTNAEPSGEEATPAQPKTKGGFWLKAILAIVVVVAGFMYIKSLAEKDPKIAQAPAASEEKAVEAEAAEGAAVESKVAEEAAAAATAETQAPAVAETVAEEAASAAEVEKETVTAPSEEKSQAAGTTTTDTAEAQVETSLADAAVSVGEDKPVAGAAEEATTETTEQATTEITTAATAGKETGAAVESEQESTGIPALASGEVSVDNKPISTMSGDEPASASAYSRPAPFTRPEWAKRREAPQRPERPEWAKPRNRFDQPAYAGRTPAQAGADKAEEGSEEVTAAQTQARVSPRSMPARPYYGYAPYAYPPVYAPVPYPYGYVPGYQPYPYPVPQPQAPAAE